MDIKGVMYRASIMALAGTAMVVNIGPTEAKVGGMGGIGGGRHGWVGSYELRLRSTSIPRYRLVCNCFPDPGGGLPVRIWPGTIQVSRSR